LVYAENYSCETIVTPGDLSKNIRQKSLFLKKKERCLIANLEEQQFAKKNLRNKKTKVFKIEDSEERVKNEGIKKQLTQIPKTVQAQAQIKALPTTRLSRA
jgi:uncharacterized protein YlaI